MQDKSLNQLRKSINKKMSKITQKDLAKHTGVTQAFISKALSGKSKSKMTKEVLQKIDRHLSYKFSNN